VPPITLERIDDLLRARILIEGEAIALAAARMGPREIATIETILGEWDDAGAETQEGCRSRSDAQPELPFRDLLLLRFSC
jgi:DNA-binding GntR family transcriptional regulator